jgi:uncharacterized OsmC-like protein
VQRDVSAALSALEEARTRAQPLAPLPEADNSRSRSASASRQVLFVVPRGRGDGFRASIRGHLLELADPNSGHMLAPTPDDLLIASIASDFAWIARRFLRARELPDDVSVSATWRTREDPRSLEGINVTVTVSKKAGPVSAALATALETSLVASSLRLQSRVCVTAGPARSSSMPFA